MKDYDIVNVNRQLIGKSGRKFLQRFASFTGQDVGLLINEVEDYNRDFSAYGNEVYSQLETRAAHWANFLDQGWFQRRLDFPFSIASQYDVIIDLGFSVPYIFALPDIREAGIHKFIFVDRETTTLEFYNILLRMENWGTVSNRAHIVITDLEHENELGKISNLLQSMQSKSVLVIASEVLEHLHNPEPVMRWMSSMLQDESYSHCLLYMTLPLGLKIPSHTVEFRQVEHAKEWVNRYLPQHSAFVIRPSISPQTPYLQSVYCAWAEAHSDRL